MKRDWTCVFDPTPRWDDGNEGMARFRRNTPCLLIDAMALVVAVYATVEAFVTVCIAALNRAPIEQSARHLAALRALAGRGLTFQLAADIIETSITTSWEALGRIAVIAVIRTFLNYFLERDVADVHERQNETAKT